MTNNARYWLAEVRDCNTKFIVAGTKSEALQRVFNRLNEIHPPKQLRENGYTPYYKKDIYLSAIDKELKRYDGVLEIY